MPKVQNLPMKLVLAIVVSLILLPSLLQQTQGIRPEKRFLDCQQKTHRVVAMEKEKKSSSSAKRSSFDDNHHDHSKGRVVVVVGEDGVIAWEQGYERVTNDEELIDHGASTSSGEGEDGAARERGDGGRKEVPAGAHSERDHGQHDDDVDDEEKVKGGRSYVDMMDVAEMDYSPARRKPPIHN